MEENINKDAYIQDKNCIVCNCKFGNIGFTISKKYYCKFCFRGVCENCSEHRIDKNRCCNKCFSLNSNKESSRTLSDEIDTSTENLEQSYNDKIPEIDSEIEKLKKTIEEADEELSRKRENSKNAMMLKKKINDLQLLLSSKREETITKKKEFEEAKINLESNNSISLEDALKLNSNLKEKLNLLMSEETEHIDLLNSVLNDLNKQIITQKEIVDKLVAVIDGPKDANESTINKLSLEKEKAKRLNDQLVEIKKQIYK